MFRSLLPQNLFAYNFPAIGLDLWYEITVLDNIYQLVLPWPVSDTQHDRQTLTSSYDSVLCLTRIQHAPSLIRHKTLSDDEIKDSLLRQQLLTIVPLS